MSRDASAGDAMPDAAAADATAADASPGPACVMLASCCNTLPGAVFGQPCVTASQGSETACQMVLDQARGIDLCRVPPADGG